MKIFRNLPKINNKQKQFLLKSLDRKVVRVQSPLWAP